MKNRGMRRTLVGQVVSDKMDKSILVRVDRTVRHKRYKRYIKRSSKFMAHDEGNACKVGDVVEIAEARPLSARKRWRVRRIIRSGVRTATLEKTENA